MESKIIKKSILKRRRKNKGYFKNKSKKPNGKKSFGRTKHKKQNFKYECLEMLYEEEDQKELEFLSDIKTDDEYNNYPDERKTITIEDKINNKKLLDLDMTDNNENNHRQHQQSNYVPYNNFKNRNNSNNNMVIFMVFFPFLIKLDINQEEDLLEQVGEYIFYLSHSLYQYEASLITGMILSSYDKNIYNLLNLIFNETKYLYDLINKAHDIIQKALMQKYSDLIKELLFESPNKTKFKQAGDFIYDLSELLYKDKAGIITGMILEFHGQNVDKLLNLIFNKKKILIEEIHLAYLNTTKAGRGE